MRYDEKDLAVGRIAATSAKFDFSHTLLEFHTELALSVGGAFVVRTVRTYLLRVGPDECGQTDEGEQRGNAMPGFPAQTVVAQFDGKVVDVHNSTAALTGKFRKKKATIMHA